MEGEASPRAGLRGRSSGGNHAVKRRCHGEKTCCSSSLARSASATRTAAAVSLALVWRCSVSSLETTWDCSSREDLSERESAFGRPRLGLFDIGLGGFHRAIHLRSSHHGQHIPGFDFVADLIPALANHAGRPGKDRGGFKRLRAARHSYRVALVAGTGSVVLTATGSAAKASATRQLTDRIVTSIFMNGQILQSPSAVPVSRCLPVRRCDQTAFSPRQKKRRVPGRARRRCRRAVLR